MLRFKKKYFLFQMQFTVIEKIILVEIKSSFFLYKVESLPQQVM